MRREERGGGGSGTQNFVYDKWPDQIFPMVHFGFATMVTLVWRGRVPGGGGGYSCGSRLS